MTNPSRPDVVIIGAGPSGLACAACLKHHGIAPVILDKADRVGASWHGHYDRLHLHTHRARSGLPYLPMPAHYGRYPSRAQMIEYLQGYARHFGLAPRLGVRVTAVRPDGGRWRVALEGGHETADAVIFATGLNGIPHQPDLPGLTTFPGPVLHSSAYRNAAPFAGQRMLVVGFGNSGGDIALDLAEAGASVTLSVRSPVNILPHELFGIPITSFGLLRKILPYRWADAMTAPVIRAKIGRPEDYGLRSAAKGPAAQVIEDGRIPLIDIGTLRAIRDGGIATRPGPKRADGESIRFDDDSTGRFDGIVLATGYHTDLRALLPETPEALDTLGRPRRCGAPSPAPELWFCSYMASAEGQLRQSGLEARRIAAAIAQS